ncbi:acyl-CoA thioesterase domain-containing protein [Pseudorhodoferax sp. Leaf265]|uniref:acyl-CoA thioesterase domain-containing protein n=1 Tax=Pseudorhodoferax sp. Leaf265 TaxID=1736315 RepID=UPI0006FACE1A|nr:acyl-CoA thioesterase domain-containing protein [Pseudorhodoferax sp. Leaf265]KQP06199.1 hypothetical protein ASF45_08945 [Pseudorhodoferax sp. Leaf265]PZQ02337.1 MAG: hypothetical protein DI583_02585 [Variovorax paradoxus]PZQ15593.1 MAG: hypothetical protein DI587_02585 [Variovorax paradoxus]
MAAVDLGWHTASVPFMRTLGVCWEGQDAAGIRMRLPCAPAVLDAAGTAVDLRAVVALLDQAGGAAVYAALPSVAAATLELRVDVLGSPEPGQDVWAHACVHAQSHGSALVLGQAASGSLDAAAFMRMTARYIVGSGPGQAPADGVYLARRAQAVARFAAAGAPAAGGFDGTLDGAATPGGWTLPFAERLVGSVTLPALHGGVVGAGLLTAAVRAGCASPAQRLSAMTVRYLRAARAEASMVTARLAKGGARASFVQARLVQGERLVATAHCLFG